MALAGIPQPSRHDRKIPPMLLTLSTTRRPATDLGFLLHKNPARAQTFELPFGQVRVFYTEATDERCTAAVLLEVDPVALVRGRGGRGQEGPTLEPYVNDRPYAASSFLSVVLSRVFGSALGGRCKERPDLADEPLPLEATLAVVPPPGGGGLLRRLFEPLGYAVTATRHPLDPRFPEWGESPYYTVRLAATKRLADLLTHLYVLVPVLDDAKHYWVGKDEVEKLLARGGDWLAAHPERDAIVERYLRHQRRLTRDALARLVGEEEPDAEAAAETRAEAEACLERPFSLAEQRVEAALAVLREAGAKTVLDLGCGEGRFLRALLADRSFEKVVGMDTSVRALESAARRLHFDTMPPMQRARIDLLHGSLTYRDRRLEGFDGAALLEVIEHLDLPRIDAMEQVVLGCARPATLVVTTPNAEYNALFPNLPAGNFRHKDHRFEWTREEFRGWAEAAAAKFGYGVRFLPVGFEDTDHGPPTQMGVFTRG